MKNNRTMVITISRQMASGGAYIGHLLARTLGFHYVEREVLHQAAKRLGLEISEVASVEERKMGFIENLMRGFAFGTPEAAYLPPSRRPVYDHELFRTETAIIKAIASRYNAIIVGHGGYAILKDRPGTVRVLIQAPVEFRIKRLQTFHSISADAARDEIEEADRRREKFLKIMTGTDWYDSRNYHLAIDSEAAGFDGAQRMILELVEQSKRASGN